MLRRAEACPTPVRRRDYWVSRMMGFSLMMKMKQLLRRAGVCPAPAKRHKHWAHQVAAGGVFCRVRSRRIKVRGRNTAFPNHRSQGNWLTSALLVGSSFSLTLTQSRYCTLRIKLSPGASAAANCAGSFPSAPSCLIRVFVVVSQVVRLCTPSRSATLYGSPGRGVIRWLTRVKCPVHTLWAGRTLEQTAITINPGNRAAG